jgi:hypothetical protein
MEAKHEAVHEAIREIVLEELGFKQNQPTTIFEDNKSLIFVANNAHQVVSDRTRHFLISSQYANYVVNSGIVSFEYISTELQVADILTKPLVTNSFIQLRGVLIGNYKNKVTDEDSSNY